MSQHLAAILPSKGADFHVASRPTPQPGPDELLVQVNSVALNPLDPIQRNFGFHLLHYPTILGSDVAGVVVAHGSSVNSALFPVGARIVAFAPVFFKEGGLDYGAFQERVLVPTAYATPIPDSITFNEGAVLPMAVYTAWAGMLTLGLPVGPSSYKAPANNGIIVWAGATTVGNAAIQVARELGFVIYTTASPKHHEHLKSLGVTRAFDYKAEGLKQAILSAAKEDGVMFQFGWLGTGDLQLFAETLKELKGTGDGKKKLASAPPLLPGAYTPVDGVDVSFVTCGDNPDEFFKVVFNDWLIEKLQDKKFVPSAKVRLLEGGLPKIQESLDLLRTTSGEKLVLEL